MSDIGVSVVLGSFNRRRFLKATIESIRNNGITVPYEIIVVDGGSTDGSIKYLTSQKDTIAIVQHNRGTWRGKQVHRQSWGYFMNLGFKCAHGKFICMISDDSLLVPGAVMAGVDAYELAVREGRKVGAVAFYWRNWPEQKEYCVGRTHRGPRGKLFVNHGLYLREALESVGWLDENAYFFYHADSDVCLKMWSQGYEVIDCPGAIVEHFRHAATSIRMRDSEIIQRDLETYEQRWGSVFEDDLNSSLDTWVYLHYQDPHRTVRHFPRSSIFRYHLRKIEERARSLLRPYWHRLRSK